MKAKLKRFFHSIPMKLWLILAAVVVFAFFSNDFGLVDIQKTAVILAAGVDKTENGYRLTAQIAVPKGTDRTTGGTSSVEITGEGKTVSECVSDIYADTGWVPKFVFCDLLLLGENVVKEDVLRVFGYFLRNEYMPDSCFVAVAEGKAEEMLSSTSAIDDTSSLAITKLFSDAAEKSGRVMKNTLREFAIGYYGPSKSGYMPFIGASEQESNESSGSSSGGSGSGGSSGGQQSPQKIYSAERTAIFSEGKMTALLSKEQTFAFNLLKGKVFSGMFPVGNGEESVTMVILENKGGVSLETNAAPKVKFNVELTIRLRDRSDAPTVKDVTSNIVAEELRNGAQTVVGEYLRSLFETSRESGCDLFFLNRRLYRKSVTKYEEWKDTLLSSVPAEYEIKIKTAK